MNTERLNKKQKSNTQNQVDLGFKTCLRAFLLARVFTRNDFTQRINVCKKHLFLTNECINNKKESIN